MKHLREVVLDVYDDAQGRVARELFGDADALPDVVKTAELLSPEVAKRVPDDLYALVLHDGDQCTRKFACVDSGHTWMHLRYFLKTGHQLPAKAQRVAAQNLVKAARQYGLDVPKRLEKVAFGRLLMGAITVPEAVGKARSNLKKVKPFGGQIAPKHITQGGAGAR